MSTWHSCFFQIPSARSEVKELVGVGNISGNKIRHIWNVIRRDPHRVTLKELNTGNNWDMKSFTDCLNILSWTKALSIPLTQKRNTSSLSSQKGKNNTKDNTTAILFGLSSSRTMKPFLPVDFAGFALLRTFHFWVVWIELMNEN